MARRGWTAVVTVILSVIVMTLVAACSAPPTRVPADGWQRVPDGPLSARHAPAGAFVAGRFVIVGGWAGPLCPEACLPPKQPALRDGASFDPTTQTWRTIARAPVPVSSWGNAVVVGDRLYLMTQELHRADSPVSFLAYDPTADTWARLPLPPGHDQRLVSTDHQVVAVSSVGRDQTIIAAYDPAGRTWRRLPDGPLGLGAEAAAWLGDRLLVVGSDPATPDGSTVMHLDTLDADLRTWTELPDVTLGGDGQLIGVDGRAVFAFTSLDTWDPTWLPGPYPPYGALVSPATGAVTMLPRPPRGDGLNAFRVNVGSRTFVGGHLIDPATRQWTRIPEPSWDTSGGLPLIAASDHLVFVWGGASARANRSDGYLLDVGR